MSNIIKCVFGPRLLRIHDAGNGQVKIQTIIGDNRCRLGVLASNLDPPVKTNILSFRVDMDNAIKHGYY